MVGDFGLTTDGTSKAALSTALGRGTSGYRAPEIVKEFSTYNNKVDIFALACILYELLSEGKKLFSSDFQVLQWALTVPLKPIAQDLSPRSESLLRWMSSIDPSERLTAFELQRIFYNERALSVAYTCEQRREYDLAVKAYKTAIDNEIPELPISVKSLHSLAKSCHQLRKHMEAVHFYGIAVARDLPEADGVSMFNLGCWLQCIGDHGGAMQAYNIAAKKELDIEVCARICERLLEL
jgi:serine/threonine protein kinase